MILYVGLAYSPKGIEAVCLSPNRQEAKIRTYELRPGNHINSFNFFDVNFMTYVTSWLSINFTDPDQASELAKSLHKQIEDYIIVRLKGDIT